MATLWAVKPSYIRPNAARFHAIATDAEQLKDGAERRMAAYDRLPKAARQAVNEYGQLKAAVRGGRSAAAKVDAIKAAYQRKLERSAVRLP